MTVQQLRLRPFRLADATTVVPWLDGPGIGLPPGTAGDRWAELLLANPRVRAWIACEGEAQVGFVRLDTGPDRVAELTLAVAPQWRRRGMARRILDLVVRASRAGRLRRLYAVVDPGNAAALAFFRESAFEDCGVCAGSVRFVRWIHEADPKVLEIDG